MPKPITGVVLAQRTTEFVLFVNYASIYEEDFDRACFQQFVRYTQSFQLYPGVRSADLKVFVYLFIYLLFLAMAWFIKLL